MANYALPIALLFLSGSLSAQSNSPEYPLVLTVTNSQVSTSATGTTTHVMGSLSQDLWKQSVDLTCDVALSSVGPDGKVNTYPARWGYTPRADSHKTIRIYVREPGKNSMREYRCVGNLPLTH
jgi:hypothetical protein